MGVCENHTPVKPMTSEGAMKRVTHNTATVFDNTILTGIKICTLAFAATHPLCRASLVELARLESPGLIWIRWKNRLRV